MEPRECQNVALVTERRNIVRARLGRVATCSQVLTHTHFLLGAPCNAGLAIHEQSTTILF